jgi:nicotinamide mononucleotide transporter
MDWFYPVFNILEYSVSLLECISVTAGIIAVYLAAREKILTWPIGLINIISAFFIYYSYQLYSDMFLQCYYFAISIYGWIYWRAQKKAHISLKWLTGKQRAYLLILITISSAVLGWFVSNIHLIWPETFLLPASYAYTDTLVAVMSVIANTLMARRFIENWILWIFVNIICVYIYFQKEIIFFSLEFLIFLGIAVFGLREWIRLKHRQDESNVLTQ